MGEKRAYKPRKPGGGRKKLKPEYDAGENLKEQMESAVALYEEDCSLRSIADALTLNPIKVRKLLITAGVYESDVAEKVQDTFEEYREAQNYMRVQKFLNKFLIFHRPVGSRCVGWNIRLHMNPVGIEFVIANVWPELA